jgi:hypothetical protein
MITDLRLALRQFAKSRGFTVIATLTLAVGIGSSTAMFSTLRALVVEPFDYPDSHEIVQVWSGDGWPLSPADFHDLRDQSTLFEHFGVYQPGSVNVGLENAQAVAGARATHGVLDAFGIRPFRGRLIQRDDCVQGAERVAVVSRRPVGDWGLDPADCERGDSGSAKAPRQGATEGCALYRSPGQPERAGRPPWSGGLPPRRTGGRIRTPIPHWTSRRCRASSTRPTRQTQHADAGVDAEQRDRSHASAARCWSE